MNEHIPHKQNAEILSVHLGPKMSYRDEMTLQAVLMLRRYAMKHKVAGIDFTHPRKNPSEVQVAAMNEWVGEQGAKDVRGRYRAYIDRLAREGLDAGDIDLSDDKACAELIERIENEHGPDSATETVH